MTKQELMKKALKLKKKIQDPNLESEKHWNEFLFCTVVTRLEKGDYK
tara:strand:+ start:37 stop:177 length:141 start_codon:yes stop_codon:yes gene_type:complete